MNAKYDPEAVGATDAPADPGDVQLLGETGSLFCGAGR